MIQDQAPSTERPVEPSGDLRRDRVMVVLSTWLMVGLFLDGYAHQNISSTLETFFTPWHALFYSGSIAAAGWILAPGLKAVRSKERLRRAFPPGYGLGALGIGIFAAGGVWDVFWHMAFGIELDIDALLSPPHLLIVTGVLLMVTSPLRSAWASDMAADTPTARLWPAVFSMTLATALLSFMFMYLSPFVGPDIARPVNQHVDSTFSGDNLELVRYMLWRSGIASVLIANLLLFCPLLLLARRWSTPPGATTVLLVSTVGLMTSLYGFSAIAFVAVAALASLIIDGWLRRIGHGRRSRGAYMAFCTGAPILFWGGYLAAIALTEGIGWSLNLWLGTLIWSGMSGAGLGLLVGPPAGD